MAGNLPVYFCRGHMCESALLTRGTFPFLVFAIVTTSLALNHKRLWFLRAQQTINDSCREWISPVISR